MSVLINEKEKKLAELSGNKPKIVYTLDYSIKESK